MDCTLHQGVTLGVWRGGNPSVGDRVYIGPGAKIFGEIHIGDGAYVGANAVVHFDVPAGCVVVGVPGRIVGRREISYVDGGSDSPLLRLDDAQPAGSAPDVSLD
jgi:serine acetyltransferase